MVFVLVLEEIIPVIMDVLLVFLEKMTPKKAKNVEKV